jgi:hypothetical protein
MSRIFSIVGDRKLIWHRSRPLQIYAVDPTTIPFPPKKLPQSLHIIILHDSYRPLLLAFWKLVYRNQVLSRVETPRFWPTETSDSCFADQGNLSST